MQTFQTFVQFSTVISSGSGGNREISLKRWCNTCHVHVEVMNFFLKHSLSEWQAFEKTNKKKMSPKSSSYYGPRCSAMRKKLSFLRCGHDHVHWCPNWSLRVPREQFRREMSPHSLRSVYTDTHSHAHLFQCCCSCS